jgi:hypothetical protein
MLWFDEIYGLLWTLSREINFRATMVTISNLSATKSTQTNTAFSLSRKTLFGNLLDKT